jgi:hypothetical protein
MSCETGKYRRSDSDGDGLHTQKEVARYLVGEKKTDYLFTGKGNQPALLGDIKDLELKKTPAPNRPLRALTKSMDV